MIRSMTGFGRAEYSENGSTIVVEIHSVNGRFFDVRMKLPRLLYEYELELRKITQEYVSRGKVSVTVNLNSMNARAEGLEMDYSLADKYIALSRDIARRYDIDDTMDTRTLMAFPDVIMSGDDTGLAEEFWARTEKVMRSALEIHRAMREKEGSAIGDDIQSRLAVINGYLGQIENRIPEVRESNRERLLKRLETLVGQDKMDEIRFSMEAALYADRLDVTEECVRFRSHNEQFAHEIAREITSGKKLLFLLQEMSREANTIGSKIMDAECAQIVVKIKEELEKMREQAENME
ncbi:YicC family protein [bacterium]|nr:YicC family protein [bacterium]